MAPKRVLFTTADDDTAEANKQPAVTLDDLKGEHRKLYDDILAKLSQDLLARFVRTRHGGIWTIGHTDDLLDGVDLSTASEERSRAL